MANPKSGGKDGEFVLSSFRKLLNPIQVIDLSETPPENGLEICRMLEDLHCRVLVCGGDGTVGWVLSTLDKLQLPVRNKNNKLVWLLSSFLIVHVHQPEEKQEFMMLELLILQS